MFKSPKLSVVLTLVLITAVVFEAYQIKLEFETLNGLAENVTKPRSRAKREEVSEPNLEEQCGQLRTKTQTCLKQAQACLSVLNSFTEKNKVFEKKVKQCQQRNERNSKRNNELKARLDSVQSRTDRLKSRNEQMEL